MKTKKILENDILQVSTTQPDRVEAYSKQDLVAEKARIEDLLAEFNK